MDILRKQNKLDAEGIADLIRADLEALQDDPEFVTDAVLMDINNQICRLMDREDVSRADLARRLGWRRSAVTKMLSGNQNVSIRRLVDVAVALGAKITPPRLTPRRDGESTVTTTATTRYYFENQAYRVPMGDGGITTTELALSFNVLERSHAG